MSKTVSVLLTVLILIMLAVTCPDKSEHQEEIRQKVSEKMEQKMGDADGLSAIGSFFASKIIDVYLDSKLSVDNYVLFSIGKLNYDGEDIRISFGMLHHVFIFGGSEIGKSFKGETDTNE